MIATAPMAPTAMPALAPLERPEEPPTGDGEEDGGGITNGEDDDGVEVVLDGGALDGVTVTIKTLAAEGVELRSSLPSVKVS